MQHSNTLPLLCRNYIYIPESALFTPKPKTDRTRDRREDLYVPIPPMYAHLQKTPKAPKRKEHTPTLITYLRMFVKSVWYRYAWCVRRPRAYGASGASSPYGRKGMVLGPASLSPWTPDRPNVWRSLQRPVCPLGLLVRIRHCPLS